MNDPAVSQVHYVRLSSGGIDVEGAVVDGVRKGIRLTWRVGVPGSNNARTETLELKTADAFSLSETMRLVIEKMADLAQKE